MFIVLTVALIAIFITSCGRSSEQDKLHNNGSEDVNDEETKINEEASSENNTNDSNEDLGDFDSESEALTDQFGTFEDSDSSEAINPLSNYSPMEIEYARVWLEVVGNKDIDTLNVSYISNGESVSQYEGRGVGYPEDIVYLFTDFLAGGNVFYGSNGDGSINLYDVPTRWPTPEQLKEERNQTPEEYAQYIIDNPKRVLIDPGDDAEVENIIRKIVILD